MNITSASAASFMASSVASSVDSSRGVTAASAAANNEVSARRPVRTARRYTAQAHVATPLGPVLMARTQAGLAGVWFEAQKWHPVSIDAPERADDPLLVDAATQITDYFAGRRCRFELPLDLHGTAFQRAVWQSLCAIGAGVTVSYALLARQVGAPLAVRAVGAAVGRNPVSVIVPCHRVVGSDGRLTGYAGGLDRKRALLALEGVA